ncbi:MAG: hypothetical protein LBH05_03775 [Deferribacteraceae bacterium]|jgi:hypothetical protein|nr:hypothetical protein [Deferribacteraceae bacterium]
MKKFLLLPLLLLTVCFVACTSSNSKPEKTVDAFFQNLKKANYDKVHEYLSAPLFENVADTERELLGVYFGTMKTANLKVVEKTDSTATVNVDISAVDIVEVVHNFMTNMTEKLQSKGLSPDNVSDEELDVIFVNELKSPDAPKKTMTATLILNKTGGKWLIDADNALRTALFMQNYNGEDLYNEGNGNGYSVFDTVNATAVFTGSDEMMGICIFELDGQTYKMYCEPDQMEELTKNYSNKEVGIVYQVLQSDTEKDTGEDEDTNEEPVTLYILDSIVK